MRAAHRAWALAMMAASIGGGVSMAMAQTPASAGAPASATSSAAVASAAVSAPPTSPSSSRPQLDATQAVQLDTADYLGDWQPEPLGDPARWKPDAVIAADGSGTHLTVQAALDALPSRGTDARRRYLLVKPGTYREVVCVRNKAPFTLYGVGEPSAVVIVEGRYNALPKAKDAAAQPCIPATGSEIHGTAGSTSVALFSDDVQLTGLTIANDAMDRVRDGQGYPAGVAESGGAQAVALMTAGDRIQMENVRLLGHQDTFFAELGNGGRATRVLVRRSEIRGDVDFIFGGATLVIDDSLIVSRAGRRSPGHGGHVLAPSTREWQPHGFLVRRSRLLAEPGVTAGSISLGRAWDHGVAAGTWRRTREVPNGQALIRDSLLGPHLTGWSASTSRRPFATQGETANRFSEYRNTALPSAAYQALPDGDGWASVEGGTQGGAAARPEHVLAIRSRADLDAAFALGDTPKILALMTRIDLAADASGRRLTAADFRDPAFDFDAFVRDYDPARWGRRAPSGPQEDARRASAKRQAAQVVARVPSRTTLIGVTPDAGFEGGMLLLEKVEQVILRGLRFADAYDHFPAWDPEDNGHGEWNSDYDTVSLRQARRVWIDHCAFDDGDRPDQREAVALGQRIQRHDGLLDITRQSDLVTVSWNLFRRHDKTLLIGGGDRHLEDAGHLRVTLHHNLWEQVKERTPRVRFGQVHVANNLFIARSDVPYAHGYSLGVGLRSQLLSEANAWEADAGIGADRLVRQLKGERFEDRGSWLNGAPVDLVSAWRTANPRAALVGTVDWTPPYRLSLDPVSEVASRVRAGAGTGRLW
ncbi:pectinesterase family protein [Roseateles amylovorans]|uniref:Pectinesterase family protein n=1 Tax=Roseateles amylovorans TaxID=2978473 RepID=A0ABY6AX82_9BURK|nr:pectinesterase family protein [Roseateles amylovorans]UXH77528.1 pectinesterase family protein [Roseateles amylovorans]